MRKLLSFLFLINIASLFSYDCCSRWDDQLQLFRHDYELDMMQCMKNNEDMFLIPMKYNELENAKVLIDSLGCPYIISDGHYYEIIVVNHHPLCPTCFKKEELHKKFLHCR